MEIKALRGTGDILPGDAERWQYLEETARRIFNLYGYQEIRTPIIEQTSLFTRSIGETSDIVQKEMYTFRDRKNRSISLRPEGTAPVVRAYLEHGLHKEIGFVKLFYIGPMFRSERPQRGRQRQFHHIGVEAIGSYSPHLDTEVLSLLVHFLHEIGLKDFSIKLNSLGCQNDKAGLAKVLKEELRPNLNLLCEDCQNRFERNVFRVLDCKHTVCKRVTLRLPAMLDKLCKECEEHLEKVKTLLDSLKIPYRMDAHLVRGLDYYTKTAFEVTHPSLGAQDALGAGGRYDGLVGDLGGPATGAAGFALGAERVMLALEKTKVTFPLSPPVDLYITTIGKEAYEQGFGLLDKLRRAGICAQIDFENKSLKGQMRIADRLRSTFVAILGEDELRKGLIVLRNMSTSKQEEIKIDGFTEEIKKRLGK